MILYQENDFQPYMPDVDKYSRGLIEMNNQWESVKLLCEINCPIQAKSIMPNMTNIQNNFSALQDDLISSLISETKSNLYKKAKSKAQAAVDILIRNLYERTADVGFLATDDDIRNFTGNSDRTESDVKYIINRLKEYQEKYTVYDEIIILDSHFKVIANLDEKNEIAGKFIDDPLLSRTYKTNEDFVETFGYSQLQPKKLKAHIFSKKIKHEITNETIGILCLCFRFGNEMGGIFKKLCTDYDGSAIVIIDENDCVIASSDINHIPKDIKVETVSGEENAIVYYRGAEYIAKTVSTNGYQGYFGIGWRGHIMIPLNLAFKDKATEALSLIDQGIMTGLMKQADSFSTKLHVIMEETKKINYSLKRIIYNGQIIANDRDLHEEYLKLRPILNSIKKTGAEMCKIFEKSVKNLFATVISASLREDMFLAAHCIDIMDRNLYERSDDCRWWALNPTFKEILSKNAITEQDKNNLTKILQYINSLYTVYTVLFLFDKDMKIIAVSNPAHNDKIGMRLDDEYIKGTIKNSRGENYFVSPFKQSPLYEDRHTYIYSASVTDPNSKEKTVGGIGIVFDSEFQFKSMLEESISLRENSFAIFADRSRRVISSTNDALSPGAELNLPKKFFDIKNGEAFTEIIIYDDAYYAVGYACSSGYREYKCSDGYQNDVIAFVFEKLADCKIAEEHNYDEANLELKETNNFGNCKTFGTFRVGGHLFGLEQCYIVESVEKPNITALPESSKAVKGVMEYRGQFLTVLDAHEFLGGQTVNNDYCDTLIVRFPDSIMAAIIVDQLINVIEISENIILPAPSINGSTSLVKNVVCSEGSGGKALLIIDEQKLLAFAGAGVMLNIDLDLKKIS